MAILLSSLYVLLWAQAASEPPGVKYNVALVAAGATVSAAIITAVLGFVSIRKNQRDLELLRAEINARKDEVDARRERDMELLRGEISNQKGDLDARRDYKYEAHKRLYIECEPLLFQLAELSEHALYRVYSLSRTARNGDLPDWLQGDGYYKCSTIYRLIVPLIILRLIQRRLTFIDLSLDNHIAGQYALLKFVYLTFTDAFDFARMDPPIPYDPNVGNWQQARSSNPSKHWRQGLNVGTLDNAIDALLTPKDTVPWMSYGQFEAAFRDPNSTTSKAVQAFSDMLEGFHPRHRPILWRMLTAQCHIYQKILESRSGSHQEISRISLYGASPILPPGNLDWRQRPDEASDDEAVVTPRRVAEEYLRSRLPMFFGNEAVVKPSKSGG
jgi:hypothetical protein